MFRRMREDEEPQANEASGSGSNTSQSSAPPMRPLSQPTSNATTTTYGSSSQTSGVPSQAQSFGASAASQPQRAATPVSPVSRGPSPTDSRSSAFTRGNAQQEQQSSGGSERLLIVGKGISLEGGKISNCDRLVVDGRVVATLSGVREIEINESGVFEGEATIENADINGLFKGKLIVDKRLVINSSGKVNGKVAYGEIEIARGGELSGEIIYSDEASGSQFLEEDDTGASAGNRHKSTVAA